MEGWRLAIVIESWVTVALWLYLVWSVYRRVWRIARRPNRPVSKGLIAGVSLGALTALLLAVAGTRAAPPVDELNAVAAMVIRVGLLAMGVVILIVTEYVFNRQDPAMRPEAIERMAQDVGIRPDQVRAVIERFIVS